MSVELVAQLLKEQNGGRGLPREQLIQHMIINKLAVSRQDVLTALDYGGKHNKLTVTPFNSNIKDVVVMLKDEVSTLKSSSIGNKLWLKGPASVALTELLQLTVSKETSWSRVSQALTELHCLYRVGLVVIDPIYMTVRLSQYLATITAKRRQRRGFLGKFRQQNNGINESDIIDSLHTVLRLGVRLSLADIHSAVLKLLQVQMQESKTVVMTSSDCHSAIKLVDDHIKTATSQGWLTASRHPIKVDTVISLHVSDNLSGSDKLLLRCLLLPSAVVSNDTSSIDTINQHLLDYNGDSGVQRHDHDSRYLSLRSTYSSGSYNSDTMTMTLATALHNFSVRSCPSFDWSNVDWSDVDKFVTSLRRLYCLDLVRSDHHGLSLTAGGLSAAITSIGFDSSTDT